MQQEVRPKRILLVDDDLDILIVTRMALEVVGDFVTDSCSSGEEALAYVEEFQPDLILVDVMMPYLDGLSFVQQLKLNPKFAQIPVIFMSALTGDITKRTACLHAEDFFTKPLDLNRLEKRIEELLHHPASLS